LDEKPHDILEERSARRNVKLSESFEKRVRPFEMEMWVRRFSLSVASLKSPPLATKSPHPSG
jgi:hypothetical protein